jgi:hypothetical protein
VQLPEVLDFIRGMGEAMKDAKNSVHQTMSIIAGIRKYLENYFLREAPSSQLRKELSTKLVGSYFEFPASTSSLLCHLLDLTTDKMSPEGRGSCEERLYNEVSECVMGKRMDKETSKKCCAAVHSMNLYRRFKAQDLVGMVGREIRENNWFLKDREGRVQKELVEALVTREVERDPKTIRKVI